MAVSDPSDMAPRPRLGAIALPWSRLATHSDRLFWIKAITLAALTVVVVLLRRPDQFAAPYVWVEDGTQNLRDFLDHGWSSLWHPISGYFSLPIKFIHALSMTVSFRWLPEISLALTLVFCYGVLAAIAFAPTTLRWPFACAVAVLLVPTDAEVFGVSLYVGWWGTLLVLLALLWNMDGRRGGLRLVLIAVGALSSPLVVGLVPLYALRAALLRRRNEFVATAATTVFAAMQWIAVSRAGVVPGTGMLDVNMATVVERFFGFYLDSSDRFAATGGAVYLGVMLVLFLAGAWLAFRKELGPAFVLLGLALGVAIITSISRVGVESIHPIYGGPRYFFFPYILLSWVLVQIASLDRAALRLSACMLMAMAVRNTLDGGRRTHQALDWRGEIAQCLSAPSTQLRIHFAGDANVVWRVSMTREECAALLRRSWFDNLVSP
jgi:hypothetical protein